MVNDKAMSQSSICLPPENCGMMYEVISSVDISKPDETADHKAILSEGGQMYVSKKIFTIMNQGGSRTIRL